ncbi:MAG: amino acid ABC transporter substrate-binding protein [Alteromonadaceae bacterium]|nr:amino acid ABC transporter substrate-binding protein [Alteromonadaceae bacterium]
MSVKTPVVIRLCLLLMLLLPGVVNAQPSLRVGVLPSNYPFTFQEAGVWQGFEIDLIKAAGRVAGLEVELVPGQSGTLREMFERGELDTLAATAGMAPEQNATFTQPYIYSGPQIVVRRGDERIAGIDDLGGKVVALKQGTPLHQWLDGQSIEGGVEYISDEMGADELVAIGRADALVIDRVEAMRLIARKPLPLHLAGDLLFVEPRSLPFSRTPQGQALRIRVDDAITELKLDGTLGRMSQKWLGGDITRF